MESEGRAIVRRALDALKPYLSTYVAQALADAPRARAPEREDMQALLGAMLEHWEGAFARRLPTSARHYVFELKDVRNRWAHEEPFTDDEVRRAVDTARMLAKAIRAPTTAFESRPASPRHDMSAPATTAPPGSSAHRSAARRDARGVILNAYELVADDVATQRVRCPACGKKDFKSWPAGWDAHAAHACKGLPRGSESVRKAEYRRRFSHLFRDDGVAAAPSRQRDVMRRLFARYGRDEERLVFEYAAAERRGEVARARNTYGLTAEDYARRLLADALKKGWLERGERSSS